MLPFPLQEADLDGEPLGEADIDGVPLSKEEDLDGVPSTWEGCECVCVGRVSVCVRGEGVNMCVGRV